MKAEERFIDCKFCGVRVKRFTTLTKYCRVCVSKYGYKKLSFFGKGFEAGYNRAVEDSILKLSKL